MRSVVARELRELARALGFKYRSLKRTYNRVPRPRRARFLEVLRRNANRRP